MTPEARETLDALKKKLRKASLAQLGGFRPSEDSITSWFGQGVCKVGEALPMYAAKPMFPLL